MADLSTTYLGLALKNPVLIASSGLTSTVEGVRKAAQAGAGGIVLKSLFEEQLRAELAPIASSAESHPEADAFLAGMGMNQGTAEYLKLVQDARRVAGVPVIASVNCSGDAFWVDFASQIASAGANALELNIGIVPTDPNVSAATIEDGIVSLVSAVAKAVKIPVSAKLGASYTNFGNIASRLSKAGARGLTLFNRFYRMDVDLDTMSIAAGPARGGPESYFESLRWISLLEGRVGAELCASGGVHDGATALRMIAVGAHAVQLCSAIYTKGYGAITTVVDEMQGWMDGHGVKNLAAIRGRLARRNSDKPELYGRLHYIKALTGQS